MIESTNDVQAVLENAGASASRATQNRTGDPNRQKAQKLEQADLLLALLTVGGRIAFPEVILRTLVMRGSNQAYISAYNLLDGSRSVREAARLSGLDPSYLNKVVMQWIEQGIVLRLSSTDSLIHLYKLSALTTDELPSETSPKARSPRAEPVVRRKSSKVVEKQDQPSGGQLLLSDRLVRD